MGNADIHIHSSYSHDGTTTVRAVLKQAASVGLDVIAISDHDVIRGSLAACDLAPQYGLQAIPAVEISTREGHLLALFVEQPIPAQAPLIETLLRIGDLGGIAIAPHPVNPLPHSLPLHALEEVMAHKAARKILKGYEVYNMGYEIFTQQVKALSAELPLARMASSDAHIHWTIGNGRTGFRGQTAEELRIAIEKRKTVPIPAPQHFTLRPILSWMGLVLLRRFGYVSDNLTPEEPIRIRRLVN
jgi:predicted metal-dependent phosphoesterase TrpH